MIKGLKQFSYEERILEKRKLRISHQYQCIYKYLKEGYEEEGSRLFTVVSSGRTRGNGHKLNGRFFPFF